MSIVINILLVIEVLICLLLILLVLMQRPKNEGLGAAFGGGMTENLFGAQTTNVLQTLTRNLGIGFFIISAALGWLSIRQNVGKSSIQKELSTLPVPAAATPTTPPGDLDKIPVEGGTTEAPKAKDAAPGAEKSEGAPPPAPGTVPPTDSKATDENKAAPPPAPAPGANESKPADAAPAPGTAPAPAPAPAPGASDAKSAESAPTPAPAPAPEPEAPKPAEPPKQ
jgi:preprotein translocase subunit SecG